MSFIFSLAWPLLNVTEKAAIATYPLIGRGDKNKADQCAVESMRTTLNALDFQGRIVIGEGELDDAPMLAMGEEFGTGKGYAIDIAVDPLEGTKLTSVGGNNAVTVIAFAQRGKMLQAPDVYMKKLVVGPGISREGLSVEGSVGENLNHVAKSLKKKVSDLTLCTLNRERHQGMIEDARSQGARIKLLSDGDILGGLYALDPFYPVDIYMGIGGAPEGVLTAAAAHSMNGYMEAKFVFYEEKEQRRASKFLKHRDKIYCLEDLVSGDVLFSMTGVTGGDFVKGVEKKYFGYQTETFLVDSLSKISRKILSDHKFF